jgi:hypothetical protein
LKKIGIDTKGVGLGKIMQSQSVGQPSHSKLVLI